MKPILALTMVLFSLVHSTPAMAVGPADVPNYVPPTRGERIIADFSSCLGREPEPEEYDYWMAQSSIQGICNSEEGNLNAIQASYIECLGHTPLNSDLDFWNAQCQDAPNHQACTQAGICSSDEARIRTHRRRMQRWLTQTVYPHREPGTGGGGFRGNTR